MLNQRLQQSLVQKLSPQQILVMHLLQEPLLALEQQIKQEITPAVSTLQEPAAERASGQVIVVVVGLTYLLFNTNIYILPRNQKKNETSSMNIPSRSVFFPRNI